MVAGCGSDSSSGESFPECDYTEVADATNDAMPEMTGITVGDTQHHICGDFDQGHYASATQSADDDRYRITLAGTAPTLVDLEVQDGLDIMTGITVRFFDGTGTLVAKAKPVFADHIAFITTLAPGDYDMVVSANAPGALIGFGIRYRVRLATMPACDADTGTASYTEKEAHSADSNGTVSVDFSKDPSFAAMSASMPEATGLSIEPGKNQSITGTIDAFTETDQYLDRDTYEIETNADTNELGIRLTWDGTTSDLDYIVFEESTMLPIIASNISSDTGPELQMFAVKPNTKYWVWVGGFMGSMATPYRATVCGQKFLY